MLKHYKLVVSFIFYDIHFNTPHYGPWYAVYTGDFFYVNGSSGWTDISIGNLAWDVKLEYNDSIKGNEHFYFPIMIITLMIVYICSMHTCCHLEEFLYVTSAPGQQLTEAQARTPLLGPSGPVCTMQFSYSLTGRHSHIGTTTPALFLRCPSPSYPEIIERVPHSAGVLSVYVVDSVLGTLPALWEFAGRTNETAEIWIKQDVYIGAREHRFQVLKV